MIKIGADKHPKICNIQIRTTNMQGSSQIINVNKIQKAIIDKQNAGINNGEKQIIRENEHNRIVIIITAKLMRMIINRNIRRTKKYKTDITRKIREFPSTTYNVKRHPNAPQT